MTDEAEPTDEVAVEAEVTDEVEPVDPLRRSRIDVVAGVVLLVYALWVTVQLAALLVSEETYDDLAGLHAGLVPRLALGLVLLAGIWHTAQGALALLATRVPALARRPGPIRQVVAFVTLAAGIPGALVVLWPALVGIPT